MSMTKHVSACAALALAALTAGAAEYFVNPNPGKGNDAWDGTSAEWQGGTVGPKRTVQAAVDLADGNGTVVTLAPGVYDEGGRVNAGSYAHSNRVVVSKSNVTIRSATGRPADVAIVGHLADTADRMGPDAMRCLTTEADAENVVASGITFRNGAGGITGDTGTCRGGGLLSLKGLGGLTIVDCVVSNCWGSRGGGAYQVIAHSCRFTRNGATSHGPATCFSKQANCLIDHNMGSSPLGYSSAVVNCTIVDNGDAAAWLNSGKSAGSVIANSVVFGQAKSNGDSGGEMSCWCSVVGGSAAFKSVDGATVTGNGYVHSLVAPVLDDFHPVAGGVCIGLGEAAYLDNVPLPTGYTYHDLDGNELPDSGVVTVGAYQTAKTPVGGCIDFSAGDLEVEGSANVAKSGQWIWPTAWPVTYRFKSQRADLYALYVNESYDAGSKVYHYRYPQYDGWIDFTPPPDPTLVQTLKAQTRNGDVYVNAATGDDSWDGTSAVKASGDSKVGPKKTLQAAVDAAPESYYVVHVAPGDYDEGGSVNSGSSNRVNISAYSVMLLSDVKGGATIWGAPDPETKGLGPNAVRCVYLGQKYACVQGFVLAGGYTANDNSSGRGGGFRAGTAFPQVLDCVISNCCAYAAGCSANGRTYRSRFVGNRAADNYMVRGGTLVSCVFADNAFAPEVDKSLRQLFDANVAVYGCTVDCNGYRPANGTKAYCTLFFNGNHIDSGYTNYGSLGFGADDEPWFADASACDYRLGVLSPAIGCATREDLVGAECWPYLSTDVDGRAPVYSDEGRRTGGACLNEPLAMSVVDMTADGRQATTNVVFSSNPVVVTATDWQTRPFLGFEVNGETQTLETASCTFVPTTKPGALNVVRALYGTDWYVNVAKTESPSTFGSTPETAFHLLSSAGSRARDGDTIHVAEGTYEEGEMLHDQAFLNGTPTIGERIWVKDGVTLVSDAGAERTVIRGRTSDDPADDYGNGPGALRCVALGERAKVCGFTLTGGHSTVSDEISSGHDYDDNSGGGVLGSDRNTSEVRDCTVVGNCATRSGAGANCRFIRSRITGCTAVERGSVGRYCRYNSCVIDGCRGMRPIEIYSEFDSCTVGDDFKDFKNKNATVFDYGNATLVNSLVRCAVIYGDTSEKVSFAAENCVFTGAFGTGEGCRYTLTDCILTNAEAVVLDADYRPVVGSCVGIDRADDALSDEAALAETDLSGFQRVMNGRRDIGALEGDWRMRYAADIGGRVRVAEVSPEVFEDEDGKVLIPSGKKIELMLVNRSENELEYLLTGLVRNGTLAIELDGMPLSPVVASDDPVTQKFMVPNGMHSLLLAMSEDAEASARVLSLRKNKGLLLQIR